MDNNNILIENFNSQTASLIGNLNFQIAKLMTENQRLHSQVQDMQTQLKMAKINSKNKSNDIKSDK